MILQNIRQLQMIQINHEKTIKKQDHQVGSGQNIMLVLTFLLDFGKLCVQIAHNTKRIKLRQS